MAITFNKTGSARSDGARYIISGDLTLDGTYPANGYVVTAALFKHRNTVTHIETTVTTNGFIAVYIPSTSKLKFFKTPASGALVEVAASDLTGDTVRLHITGK